MAADLQMFLLLFKSKCPRKCYFRLRVLYLFAAFSCFVNVVNGFDCWGVRCGNGVCVNGICVCSDGWHGSSCQYCEGKVRLSKPSGYISDGKGNDLKDKKCTWLIDSGILNTSIRLHLEKFATVFGRDHLYIYDGDSVTSPLLAVFSGLVNKQGNRFQRITEVMAHSGSALLHFSSDIFGSRTDFNISYRFASCPSTVSWSNCSGLGECKNGVCKCYSHFTGEACDTPICSKNCSYPRGVCDRKVHRCICRNEFKGDDCSQEAALGYWETIESIGLQPKGSASHGAVVWQDSLYIIGGESYGQAKMVYVYNFTDNVWRAPQLSGTNVPRQRYGHSTVLFIDKIYMYGGVEESGSVSGELWAFDISSQTWENITVNLKSGQGVKRKQKFDIKRIAVDQLSLCHPLRSSGHIATLVPGQLSGQSKMIIIFGHSPIYGNLNTVQEYHFDTRKWGIAKTRGYPVKGGYGHTAVWDPLHQLIFVYGGYTPLISGQLFSYDPYSWTWKRLSSAPSAHFLHSAVILQGLLLFFGGNKHYYTVFGIEAAYYTSDFFVYDPICDKGVTTQGRRPAIPSPFPPTPRFGHSSVVFKGKAYVFGGFDGQMLSDLQSYTPGNCSYFKDAESCLNAYPGVKCVWVGGSAVGRGRLENILAGGIVDGHCEIISEATRSPNETSGIMLCPKSIPHLESSLIDKDREVNNFCSLLKTCASCVQTSKMCTWCTQRAKCVHGSCEDGVKGVTLLDWCPQQDSLVCSQIYTCHACSAFSDCHWTRRSQCRSKTYTIHGKSPCSFYRNCYECRTDPACGWCDNGSGTGLGDCLPGGYSEPMAPLHKCKYSNWFFTHCPKCQCNGHSTCANGTSVCNQPCANHTHGANCQHCILGYYGKPINGGHGSCECNNQTSQCDLETGKCYCTTKGAQGYHCEECDKVNNYFGDHGSCFYKLIEGSEYTLNLSKEEDYNYTKINFKTSPVNSDSSIYFAIDCSEFAKMNISLKIGKREKYLVTDKYCSSFWSNFDVSEYSFGTEELTTFQVYIYDFHPPLEISISFFQLSFPKEGNDHIWILNIIRYTIRIFLSLFSLAKITAIILVIILIFHKCGRRKRSTVEIEQMESRPFSQVVSEVESQESGQEADHEYELDDARGTTEEDSEVNKIEQTRA